MLVIIKARDRYLLESELAQDITLDMITSFYRRGLGVIITLLSRYASAEITRDLTVVKVHRASEGAWQEWKQMMLMFMLTMMLMVTCLRWSIWLPIDNDPHDYMLTMIIMIMFTMILMVMLTMMLMVTCLRWSAWICLQPSWWLYSQWSAWLCSLRYVMPWMTIFAKWATNFSNKYRTVVVNSKMISQ